MKNNKNDPEYRLEVISDSLTFYLLIERFVKLLHSNIESAPKSRRDNLVDNFFAQ
jgi:hypothetical protein